MTGFEAPDGDDEDKGSTFDRTRADYTGVDLDEEFQPVDEVELAEEGLTFDDPEHPNKRRAETDPDDVGWDLDK
jgi:hypothetical protein